MKVPRIIRGYRMLSIDGNVSRVPLYLLKPESPHLSNVAAATELSLLHHIVITVLINIVNELDIDTLKV